MANNFVEPRTKNPAFAGVFADIRLLNSLKEIFTDSLLRTHIRQV